MRFRSSSIWASANPFRKRRAARFAAAEMRARRRRHGRACTDNYRRADGGASF